MNHLTEEQIIQFLEQRDQPETEVQAHLEECDYCQQQLKEMEEVMDAMKSSHNWTPPQGIAEGLAHAIQYEQQNNRSTLKRAWQIAAAVALLILGFSLGKWTQQDSREELIALRSQVELLKEIATVNTLSQPTASQRIQAVNQIDQSVPSASDQVIKTLIKTLNNDESPNVRYSAAQALARFTDREIVRLELAKSLEVQTDPLIQIALISMLTEAQEKNAVKPLRQLIEAENTTPEVRKQAEIAVEILI